MESSTAKVDALQDQPKRVNARPASQRLSRAAQWRLFILALVIGDTLMALAGFRLAYWARFELSLPIFQAHALDSIIYYQQIGLSMAPLWLIVYAAEGLYRRENLLGGTQEYSLVFRATTIALLLVFLIGFLTPEFVLARGWLLLAWVFTFMLVAFGRFISRRIIYVLRRSGYFLAPAVIVGANSEGLLLAEQLMSWTTSGLNLVGFVDENRSIGSQALRKLPVLGKVGDLDAIIDNYRVEEVILATSGLSREDILAIFERYGFMQGVHLRMSSGLFEIITTGLNVKEFAYVPLVGINKVRLTGADRLLKLTLDYGVALPLLILSSPLLLFLAILVKLDSRGPVIHRRRVMGVNGTQFDAYKFRTMQVNGDAILADRPDLREELAEHHKLKNDPRVTRIGHFLRKFSLDELPQLFNVLKREMSLAGPRMISPEEMPKYDQWGMNLLTVQPGITGLWQVSGRSDIDYQERVRMDMYYIRNWTIWLDLQLLFQTIPAVIRGRGAY